MSPPVVAGGHLVHTVAQWAQLGQLSIEYHLPVYALICMSVPGTTCTSTAPAESAVHSWASLNGFHYAPFIIGYSQDCNCMHFRLAVQSVDNVQLL